MLNNEPISLTPFGGNHPESASMKVRYLVLATSLVPVIIALIWLPNLPAQIPGHWDFAGNVTRYGSRWEALLTPFTFLTLNLGLALGFRKRRLPESQKILIPSLLAINLVSVVLTVSFLSQMGAPAQLHNGSTALRELAFPFLMCLLLSSSWIYTYPIFKGAAHGEPNSLIGFRTSATLANKANWQSGNLLAARYLLFVSIGQTLLALAAYAWLFVTGNHEVAIWWHVFTASFALWFLAAMIVVAVVHQRLKATSQN